jgi:hypothetical protein
MANAETSHGAEDRPVALHRDLISQDYWRSFLAVALAYAVLFAPLILVGRPLLDDIGRSMTGRLYFIGGGRPLADILYTVLNFGAPAVAVYVLNQAVAVVFVAAAGTLLAALFDIRRPLIAALAVLPLAGHPYFLENMSFTFDSPLMAAALLAATAAAAAVVAYSGWKAVAAATMLLLCSLFLYQPAASVFFPVWVLFVLKNWIGSRERTPNGSIFFRGLGAAVMAAVAYYVYAANFFDTSDAYVAQHASFLSSAGVFVEAVTYNTGRYWNRLCRDWRFGPITIVTALALLSGLVALVGGKRERPAHTGLRIFGAILVLGAFILQFGVVLILNNPSWPPRVFVAVGIFPTLAALQAGVLIQRLAKAGALWAAVMLAAPFLALDYGLLVTAAATGAAAKAQGTFEAALASRVISDIGLLKADLAIKKVAVMGAAPTSPVMVNTARRFPVVGRVVSNPLRDDWWWAHELLAYNGLDLEYQAAKQYELPIENGNMQPALTRRDYVLYLAGDTLIIHFRYRTPPCFVGDCPCFGKD